MKDSAYVFSNGGLPTARPVDHMAARNTGMLLSKTMGLDGKSWLIEM